MYHIYRYSRFDGPNFVRVGTVVATRLEVEIKKDVFNRYDRVYVFVCQVICIFIYLRISVDIYIVVYIYVGGCVCIYAYVCMCVCVLACNGLRVWSELRVPGHIFV